ncbi:E3 ubiquitin-protein ligase FANCL-like [Porites lutea]|uniref:E3 ubiquitin-protein ligase FANCL-like n=1 Tax=Porites lutea TaxID=51062 RepID=UPI003CC64B89
MAGRVLDVLDVCPQLVPQDRTKRFYDGYITVCKKNFRICIQIPDHKSMENARIECGWKLRHLLRGYEGVIKQRLAQSRDLPSFLVELKSILEKLLKCQRSEKVGSGPKFYTHLVTELEAIGWDKLAFVDPSFEVLKFAARDNRDREHFITVHLSSQHPQVAPTCTTELPGQHFSFSWNSQSHPLEQLYQQFQQVLCQFENFWDMLDEIDCNTWVLEPDHPSRSCTNRRIALGNNASIQIDLNPTNPRLLPECRFLGADNVILPLREHLNANIQAWNPQLSVLENLESLLGQKFPSPSTTKKEDFSMECGICYAYRLNDLIPDKACDDSRCGQPFHSLCLYEWLRALPSSRQSFNMVFGECPYCSKPITVKMVTGK